MTELYRMSDCLDRIMKRRDLSLSALAGLLGYKSKTTIARIMRGEAGVASVEKVAADIRRCDALALSRQEEQMLDAALRISKNGEENIRFNDEMWDFLRAAPVARSPITLCTIDEARAPENPRELFRRCAVSERCEILVINCCFGELMRLLGQEALGAPGVKVRHLLYDSGDCCGKMRRLRTFFPLLCFDSYHPFYMRGTNGTPPPDVNAVAIRLENHSDVTEYELLFPQEDQGVITCGSGLLEKWHLFCEGFPLEAIRVSHAGGLESMVGYMEEYLHMEEGREIFKIKQDLCICFVSADIVRNAFRDGCHALNLAVSGSAVRTMTDIHRKRFHNIYHRGNMKTLVVSERGMWEFVRTGRHSDQAFFIRPYTVIERIEILSFCINQLEANPYFHIYVLDEASEREMPLDFPEVICCGDQVVELTPGVGVDYNLQKGVAEMFFRDRELIRFMREFFVQELLRQRVHPQTYTVELFKRLLAYLSGGGSAEE